MFTGRLGASDSKLGAFQLGSSESEAGTEHDESASSTIVLVQAVVDDYEFPRSLSDTLVLVSSVVGTFHEASNTLVLVDSVVLTIDLIAENVMLLTQEAVSSIKSESLTDMLNLVQTAAAGGDINQTVVSLMALVDSAVGVGPVIVEASNNLTITQIDPVSGLPVSSGETAPSGFTVNEGLRQSVSIHQSITNIAIQQYLSLSDKAAPTYEESIVDVLALVQSADRIYTFESLLVLTQSAVAYTALGTSDVLELIDVATFNLNSVQDALSELSIQHALAFYIITGNLLCTYTPFVGEGALGNPVPPPMTPPTIP